MTANARKAIREDTQAPETARPQCAGAGMDDHRDRQRASSLGPAPRPGDHHRLDSATVRACGRERTACPDTGRARPSGEVTAAGPETVESLLAEVIAVLAGALADAAADRPRRLPPRRPFTVALAVTAARREMTPVAARLARSVAAGERKRTSALLSRPRTRGEWKALAVTLAAAADPERITAPEAPAQGARARRRAS